MFSWFHTKESEAFGVSLAQFFIERQPQDKRKTQSAKKQQRLINDMRLKISVFTSQNKMNFYKRAKLWNSFKWTLYNAGFDREYVDDLTYSLVLMN